MEINSQIKVTKIARDKHTKQLEIETDKLEASSRVKRNEIIQDIEKCEQTIKEKVEKAKGFSLEAVELGNQVNQLAERKKNLEFDLAELKRRKDIAEKNIKNLESQRGDKMKAYGHRMPQVLAAIRQETRWEKRKPIGPFGSTIELIEPDFANVLESVLNKSLNGFVVESFNDKNLLYKILSNHQMKGVPVFVSEYDLFDYSSGEPDPKYLTVARAIKFNDEWVKRQLITMNKIEKMLLMKNREHADKIMYNRPRNIDLCFTSEGHKVGGKRGMKTETVEVYRGTPRFQKDVDSAISYERSIIQEATAVYEEKHNEWREVNSEMKRHENQQKECVRSEMAIKRDIAGLESTIAQKKDNLKEEDPVDLNIFHDDIKECDDKIKRYAGQFQVIQTQLDEVRKSVVEIIKQMKVLQGRETERYNASETFRMKITKVENLKSKITAHLEELNIKTQTFKVRYERSKNLYMDTLRLVENWIAQSAEDYPERTETKRKTDVIQQEIRHLEALAQESEKQAGMSLKEAKEQTYITMKEYEDAKKVIDGLGKIHKSIAKMLAARIEKWEAFRAYISLAAKSYFSYYLNSRGDEGSLRFSHQAKRLDIRVSTGDQYSKGPRQKDSRSLSGGEKSFSQISLLLSLWQSISSPLIW
jgi:chromosome segregation ATPase